MNTRRIGPAGNWVSRRGQKEEHTRVRRGEILKVLQWAAELAVSPDEAKQEIGAGQLQVLGSFELDPELRSLVDNVLDNVFSPIANNLLRTATRARPLTPPGRFPADTQENRRESLGPLEWAAEARPATDGE